LCGAFSVGYLPPPHGGDLHDEAAWATSRTQLGEPL
jgi:hypothetical protein